MVVFACAYFENCSRPCLVFPATQVAYLNAQQHGTDRIYFIGNFLRANEVSCQRLSYAIDYWSGSRCEARFLEHEGYFGALGAFLMSAKDPASGTTPSPASASSSSSSAAPASSSSPTSIPAANARASPKLTVDVKADSKGEEGATAPSSPMTATSSNADSPRLASFPEPLSFDAASVAASLAAPSSP